MRLKNQVRNILFAISLLGVCKIHAQFAEFQPRGEPANDSLVYYIQGGDGCPYCPYFNPEEFGFEIQCRGCTPRKEDSEHNSRIARKLNSKYGRGWLEKYIRDYERCEELDHERDRNVVKLPYYLTLNIETHYQLDSVRAYEVFDSKGISVLKGKDKTVDVTSLEKGFYYLVLDETEMKEFIKK